MNGKIGQQVLSELGVLQLPEEVKSLLCLPHLLGDVRISGEVSRDLQSKEFKALYLLSMYEEGRVQNYFLGLFMLRSKLL